MTGSPIFKGSAQRGLDAREAAWRRSGDDPLATVLTAMVLRAGQLINRDAVRRGKPAPLTLSEHLGKALLDHGLTLSDSEAGFRTGAGLLTRLLLGDEPKNHPDIAAGALRLLAALRAAGERADPGLTWLTSLIAHRVGGKRMQDPLRKLLYEDMSGGLRRGGNVCCLRDSWDPQPGPSMPGGRVAATTLRGLAMVWPCCYSAPFQGR